MMQPLYSWSKLPIFDILGIELANRIFRLKSILGKFMEISKKSFRTAAAGLCAVGVLGTLGGCANLNAISSVDNMTPMNISANADGMKGPVVLLPARSGERSLVRVTFRNDGFKPDVIVVGSVDQEGNVYLRKNNSRTDAFTSDRTEAYVTIKKLPDGKLQAIPQNYRNGPNWWRSMYSESGTGFAGKQELYPEEVEAAEDSKNMQHVAMGMYQAVQEKYKQITNAKNFVSDVMCGNEWQPTIVTTYDPKQRSAVDPKSGVFGRFEFYNNYVRGTVEEYRFDFRGNFQGTPFDYGMFTSGTIQDDLRRTTMDWQRGMITDVTVKRTDNTSAAIAGKTVDVDYIQKMTTIAYTAARDDAKCWGMRRGAFDKQAAHLNLR